MKRLLLMLTALALLACAVHAGGANMPNPQDLPEIEGLPELMRLTDGREVQTAEDWARRREELLALYSEYMYGWWPEPEEEQVTWALSEEEKTGGTLLTITVAAGEKTASFSVLLILPQGEAPQGGWPVFIEYMPWHYQNWFTKQWVTEVSANCLYAASRGYAGVNYDCTQVAQDNRTYFGTFYTLYPYSKTEPDEQRGVLLAWAWGVSKIIDALEGGAGEALGLNPAACLVAGVSRYGKSAAVAGAFDERIRVTIPSCSGAGGTAIYRTSNTGKHYDLSSLGGPEDWVNDSQNEPFGNLKGGEGYWFCGNFARIDKVKNLPVDQHMLCALAAGERRHFILVTGITSEGWNNTEGQCLAWRAAQPVWELLGSPENNNMLIHLDGHAVLPSDLAAILDYCDVRLLGRDPASIETDLSQMKGNLFLQHNRNRLDPLFAPFLD